MYCFLLEVADIERDLSMRNSGMREHSIGDVILVLSNAKKLISVPERWTKVESAKASDGSSVGADSPIACSWCAHGALKKACHDYSGTQEGSNLLFFGEDGLFVKALRYLRLCSPRSEGVIVFNDNPDTSHSDVLKLYDDALDLAKVEMKKVEEWALE